MTDSDVSLDVLARRCFERQAQAADHRLEAEIARKRVTTEAASSVFRKVFPLVLVGACMGGVAGGGAGAFGVLVLAGIIWGAVAFAKSLPDTQRRSEIRESVELGIVAYESGEPWAVLRVHEFAVADFRERIAEHRARTIGADSEWGRARASLAEAADEAQRSAAYWRERLRAEAGE